MEDLMKCPTKYITTKYASLIVGDFNYTMINWVNFTSSNDYT